MDIAKGYFVCLRFRNELSIQISDTMRNIPDKL
jgi:hypothetical protein